MRERNPTQLNMLLGSTSAHRFARKHAVGAPFYYYPSPPPPIPASTPASHVYPFIALCGKHGCLLSTGLDTARLPLRITFQTLAAQLDSVKEYVLLSRITLMNKSQGLLLWGYNHASPVNSMNIKCQTNALSTPRGPLRFDFWIPPSTPSPHPLRRATWLDDKSSVGDSRNMHDIHMILYC